MRLTSGRWRKRSTSAAWYAALCLSRGSSVPCCALAWACAPQPRQIRHSLADGHGLGVAAGDRAAGLYQPHRLNMPVFHAI